MTRIFLTHNRSALHHDYGDRALELLSSLGSVSFHDSDADTTADDIIRQARDCEILVSFRVPPIDARLMQALPHLTAICRVAVDIRNIDLEYANQQGILVTRATPGFDASVAEWIIGVMISLARHLHIAASSYHNGQVPVALMGRELRAATLGIIGYGTIGRYLARLARAFGMRIVVNEPHSAVQEAGDIQQGSMDQLLHQSDFVVCLVPATEATTHLINGSDFQKMKRSAYFINASSADLVNEADLLHALDNEVIAGCAMDVGSAKDQAPSLALARHPRILATPRVGGLTAEAAAYQAMGSVEQIRALIGGQVPEHSVNALYALRAQRRFRLALPQD